MGGAFGGFTRTRLGVSGRTRVDELHRLILRTSTVLGRLIYVACLWNPLTGRYDRGLPTRFLSLEAEEALGRWHHELFFQWLSQPSDEKQRDFICYWRSVGGSRDQIKAIRELGEAAIPPLVSPEERNAFLQDLTLAQIQSFRSDRRDSPDGFGRNVPKPA